MGETRVWRSDDSGKLYHDGCFEDGEPRTGFSPVKLDELSDEDCCESCEGVFLIGLEPDDDDEDNGDDA